MFESLSIPMQMQTPLHDCHNNITVLCIFLGFARLAIIDLSEDAMQPMISEDGKYAIIFNGEIYDYNLLNTEFPDPIPINPFLILPSSLYRRPKAHCLHTDITALYPPAYSTDIYEWDMENDTLQRYINKDISWRKKDCIGKQPYSNLVFLEDEILVLNCYAENIWRIDSSYYSSLPCW